MKTRLVTVTRKGQATIPKEMRDKHGVRGKVLAVDMDEGILLRPVPTPSNEKGSLKRVLGKKRSREILAEARSEDVRRDKELLERSLRH
jgi:AbrB family looped-hinge helix DNA binding protein